MGTIHAWYNLLVLSSTIAKLFHLQDWWILRRKQHRQFVRSRHFTKPMKRKVSPRVSSIRLSLPKTRLTVRPCCRRPTCLYACATKASYTNMKTNTGASQPSCQIEDPLFAFACKGTLRHVPQISSYLFFRIWQHTTAFLAQSPTHRPLASASPRRCSRPSIRPTDALAVVWAIHPHHPPAKTKNSHLMRYVRICISDLYVQML